MIGSELFFKQASFLVQEQQSLVSCMLMRFTKHNGRYLKSSDDSVLLDCYYDQRDTELGPSEALILLSTENRVQTEFPWFLTLIWNAEPKSRSNNDISGSIHLLCKMKSNVDRIVGANHLMREFLLQCRIPSDDPTIINTDNQSVNVSWKICCSELKSILMRIW